MERVHHVSLKRQRTCASVFSTASTQNMKSVSMDTHEGEFLRDDEIASMRGNDRQAEDISNSLLRSAGSPVVEPNPERLAHRSHNPPPLPMTASAGGVTASSSVISLDCDTVSMGSATLCPICGRGFGLAQSLRRHLKTHI